MKTIKVVFFLVSIMTASVSGFGQARAFRDFIIAASSKTNPTILAENFKEVGGASRFVSDNWSVGYALPKRGDLISEGFQFNYDYDEKTLYMRNITTKEIISVSMTSVKRFGVVNDQGDTVHFKKVYGIDPHYLNFFEVVGGTPDTSYVGIYKSKDVEYKAPNKNDYLRNFSGDYKGTYKPLVDYYLHDKSKGYKKVSSLDKKELFAFYSDYKDLVLAAFKKKKTLSEPEAAALIAEILKVTPK
jgi:hypothetical protein